jgi:HD-GYP domain-containing protein (c-di-GMP phosphodiesterase class II)
MDVITMSDFTSVRTNTLRGDQSIPFDIYVTINEKYVMFLRNGDVFEASRFQRLKDKKVKKVFIKAEDEKKYQSFLDSSLAEVMNSSSTKSVEAKSQIIAGRQAANVDAVMEKPEDQEAYAIAQASNAIFTKFLSAHPDAVRLILKEENTDHSISQHCVNVAAISTKLGEKLKLPASVIENISLGALFHDMGHLDQVDLFRKADLTADELKSYKEHPLRAGNRIKELNHFDPEIIKIIAQHEEMLDGSGFPNGLRDKQVHSLAIIIGLANAYDKMLAFEKLPIEKAKKEIMTRFVGKYPLDHIQFLQQII